jgi:DNA processing protein
MVTPNDEKHYQIALSLIPTVGPGTFRNIIGFSGSAKDFFNLNPGKVSKIYGVGIKIITHFKSKDSYLKKAEQTINECIKRKIDIHTLTENTFPNRLKIIDDSPVIIFTKGNVNLNPSKTLGIVGTRNASSYGKNITKKIIEDITSYDPTIISGLAYGIDIEAHKESLAKNLSTFGVLGSPPNKIYPSLHKDVALEMMENGGLISEYFPDEEMHPSNFPKRNRIIAGLSDAIIVVEAAGKGGALITAEIAYSYNKEVFAVPGNLQSKNSEGCNNLIRSLKASIFTGVKDITEALSWQGKDPNQSILQLPKKPLTDFHPDEQKIINSLLSNQEMDIDRLCYVLEMNHSLLAAHLLNLEFEGVIRSLPGKKYSLVIKNFT